MIILENKIYLHYYRSYY